MGAAVAAADKSRTALWQTTYSDLILTFNAGWGFSQHMGD